MLTEVTRRLKLIERQETDILRWSEPASLQTSWDKRTPFAAALCRQSKAICDIGCGNQRLRALLPPAIRYLPADLTRRTPDTALCDLNSLARSSERALALVPALARGYLTRRATFGTALALCRSKSGDSI
jgi:hypothetical protein